jgi:peroxiredoxin
MFGILLAAQVPTPKEPAKEPATKARIGDTAPDFTLPSTAGKDMKLSDFRGKKNVVLAFVVKAFTGG